MMHVGNATKLRDHLVWLRDNDKAHKFNMRTWITHPGCIDPKYGAGSIGALSAEVVGEEVSAYECRTVACLAGYCALLGNAGADDVIEDFAIDWLKLEPEQSYDLFRGEWSSKPMDSITIDDAIDHLTGLLREAYDA